MTTAKKQAAPAAGVARERDQEADPFTLAKSGWLKAINADRRLTKLCMGVAFFISDFGSVRTEGYSWPSVRAIAKNTGASDSAVEDALARLALHGYLRIESRRAQRKPSLLWLAFVRDVSAPSWGQASPETADAASPKNTDVRPAQPESTSAVLPGDISTFDREHPRKVLTSLLRESSKSSHLTTSSMPTKDSDSREDSEKDGDLLLLKEIAALHGVPLFPATEKRWRADLLKFRRHGIDPRCHLLPEIAAALIRAQENGQDRLETGTLFGRFRKPADEWRQNSEVDPIFISELSRAYARRASMIIASRAPSPEPVSGSSSPPSRGEKNSRKRKSEIARRHSEFARWIAWVLDKEFGHDGRAKRWPAEIARFEIEGVDFPALALAALFVAEVDGARGLFHLRALLDGLPAARQSMPGCDAVDWRFVLEQRDQQISARRKAAPPVPVLQLELIDRALAPTRQSA